MNILFTSKLYYKLFILHQNVFSVSLDSDENIACSTDLYLLGNPEKQSEYFARGDSIMIGRMKTNMKHTEHT